MLSHTQNAKFKQISVATAAVDIFKMHYFFLYKLNTVHTFISIVYENKHHSITFYSPIRGKHKSTSLTTNTLTNT